MGYKQFSYVSLTNKSVKGDAIPTLSLSTVMDPGSTDEIASEHGIIALFTTTLLGNSHFSSTMLDKMHRELSQLGYSISMHRILKDEIKTLKLPNSFVKEQVSAIVCIEMFDEAYSNMICELGLPTLFIDYPATPFSGPIKSDRLIMDNRSGIYSFVAEMKKRGKEKIGFLGDYKHCTSFFERYSAFRESLHYLGLPHDSSYCFTGPESEYNIPGVISYDEYLTAEFQKLKKENLPDVYICANDFIALYALSAFQKLGISVPDDVWLCGFDDSPESRIVTPKLTTIHIHSQIMGFSAVHLLISRINNPTMNYRTVSTETSLIYRESTGD